LSHVPNARKKEDQTGIKERTVESGLVRSGGKPDVVFSPPIQCVAVVTVQVKYPITLTLKPTENPNISCYSIHDPSATAVIPVSTPGDFSVQSAKELLQKPEIAAALDALKMAIKNELYFAGNTGSESKIKVMQLIGKYSKPDGEVD
jgi:hypothetical protein